MYIHNGSYTYICTYIMVVIPIYVHNGSYTYICTYIMVVIHIYVHVHLSIILKDWFVPVFLQ